MNWMPYLAINIELLITITYIAAQDKWVLFRAL